MKPELRRLHSPDIPDLSAPPQPGENRDCALVQAMAGPLGGEGEESFDFLVCTPAWISSQVAPHSPVFGKHMLVVNQIDERTISEAIQGLCEQIEGATWQEVAAQLAAYGHWEFEGYRELDSAGQA
jgi:hypothetical protein